MAQPSFLDSAGNEVMHCSASKKLKRDHVGPVKRHPSNVELMGMRFAKIEKVIKDHNVGKHRRVDNNRTRLIVPKRLIKKKRVEDAGDSENATEVDGSQADEDNDGERELRSQSSRSVELRLRNELSAGYPKHISFFRAPSCANSRENL